ncbi:UNKNOWN [Stylonychia lemnae]|uniref:Uncharacterized protein n=1 Tax=Stylonychia lemnae TaxID=5949 RepID=A0A077ZXC1_STYLE|nr:UNKNOWN [Stylonychia lemnae]|eukprot:CDW74545.1 UNKNOWN [Stylonychia lemnae]
MINLQQVVHLNPRKSLIQMILTFIQYIDQLQRVNFAITDGSFQILQYNLDTGRSTKQFFLDTQYSAGHSSLSYKNYDSSVLAFGGFSQFYDSDSFGQYASPLILIFDIHFELSTSYISYRIPNFLPAERGSDDPLTFSNQVMSYRQLDYAGGFLFGQLYSSAQPETKHGHLRLNLKTDIYFYYKPRISSNLGKFYSTAAVLGKDNHIFFAGYVVGMKKFDKFEQTAKSGLLLSNYDHMNIFGIYTDTDMLQSNLTINSPYFEILIFDDMRFTGYISISSNISMSELKFQQEIQMEFDGLTAANSVYKDMHVDANEQRIYQRQNCFLKAAPFIHEFKFISIPSASLNYTVDRDLVELKVGDHNLAGLQLAKLTVYDNNLCVRVSSEEKNQTATPNCQNIQIVKIPDMKLNIYSDCRKPGLFVNFTINMGQDIMLETSSIQSFTYTPGFYDGLNCSFNISIVEGKSALNENYDKYSQILFDTTSKIVVIRTYHYSVDNQNPEIINKNSNLVTLQSNTNQTHFCLIYSNTDPSYQKLSEEIHIIVYDELQYGIGELYYSFDVMNSCQYAEIQIEKEQGVLLYEIDYDLPLAIAGPQTNVTKIDCFTLMAYKVMIITSDNANGQFQKDITKVNDTGIYKFSFEIDYNTANDQMMTIGFYTIKVEAFDKYNKNQASTIGSGEKTITFNKWIMSDFECGPVIMSLNLIDYSDIESYLKISQNIIDRKIILNTNSQELDEYTLTLIIIGETQYQRQTQEFEILFKMPDQKLNKNFLNNLNDIEGFEGTNTECNYNAKKLSNECLNSTIISEFNTGINASHIIQLSFYCYDIYHFNQSCIIYSIGSFPEKFVAFDEYFIDISIHSFDKIFDAIQLDHTLKGAAKYCQF